MKTPAHTEFCERKGFRLRLGKAGFTITETVFAVMISSISLGAVMLLNAHQLKLIRSTRESNVASVTLQNRVEQLRTMSWESVTNPNRLSQTAFKYTPANAAVLANARETLTISSWPPAESVGKIVVEKSGQGFTVLESSSELGKQRQARVDLEISWSGADARARSRSYATVISNGGITRAGLVDLGGAGTTPGSGASPTGTPSGDPGSGAGGDSGTGEDGDASEGGGATPGGESGAGTGSGSLVGRGDVTGKPGLR